MRGDALALFNHVEIETASMCNRKCPMCLRQTIPEKGLIQPWHERHLMPYETIMQIFAELAGLDYNGTIYFSHYNEPLLDKRLPQIAMLAREMVPNAALGLYTNGDLMTAEMAGRLDGVLHWLVYASYDELTRPEREAWMKRHFDVTPVEVTHGVHIMTHFYPGAEEQAAAFLQHVCIEPVRRLILNHKGDMLLCCSDVVGRFDLGRFPDMTLAELWNSPKHVQIVRDLLNFGGRDKYDYCRACPRAGVTLNAEQQ